jgi:hypothetical protein
MNKYIDLHIHSVYSDGILTVEEIIETAKNNNAKIIAITDHDNIDGSKELLLKINSDPLLSAVSGVELSTVYSWNNHKVKIHLLGYNIDINDSFFSSELINKRNSRKKQNIDYTKKLLSNCCIPDYGIFEHVDFSKHVYLKKLLINYFSNVGIDCTAIIRYFQESPIQYIDYDFSLEQALSMIHNTGGLAVLAHPYQTKLDNTNLELMVSSLVDQGLDGIESTYARASNQDNLFAGFLAKKYNLLETCGSDFHTFIYGNFIAYGKDNNLCIDNCSLMDWLIKNGKERYTKN